MKDETKTRSNMARRSAVAAAAAALALLPVAALAHAGFAETDGFMHGFSHPLSGLDHILAMGMVGIFARQLGGRAIWLVPAAFILMMTAGAALGSHGLDLPFVELGIVLSVIVLGTVVALGGSAPAAAGVGLVAFFAIFHGHAHGAEMPQDAAGAAVAGGFILATAMLHAAGIGLGLLIGRFGEIRGRLAAQTVGGATVLAGAGLLIGLL